MSAQLAAAPQSAATHLIKISVTGQPLPADATEFAAVHDTDTGLMAAIGVCPKPLTEAGINKLIAKLNAENYAGFNNWRLPTVNEEFSHTDHTRYAPAANTDFYPDMQSDYYRTSTDGNGPWSSGGVFCVLFSYGYVYYLYRSSKAFVRPVRSVLSSQ